MSRNRRLIDSLVSDQSRLHHAYIFAGPESPAKLECAEQLAAQFETGLLKDTGAALARIRRGNHPDFLRLAPSEGLISVEEVRSLPKALAYPPLELSRRVVVLEKAQEMNVQAANALLKILEEPPSHTMFVLLCREPSELLPTVVSRCQVLRFAPLSEEEMRASLGEQAEAGTIIAFSEGSVKRAELLTASEGGLQLRREACENLLNLWEASPRIPSAVFQWVEKLVSEEEGQIALDSWELLMRDLAFTAGGAEAGDLRFPEFHPRLCALSRGGQAVVDEVSRKSASINRFRVYRQFNGNLRLDFAALLADLQLILVGKAPARELS